jgi:hypothetical protein
LTAGRPLTLAIVLASDAVAEWFDCGQGDPQICGAPQAG